MTRKYVHELREGLFFAFVGHDPGVRLSSIGGDAEEVPGTHIRGAQASTNERRARRQYSRFDAVGTPGAEFDHGPPGGRLRDTCRFRSDHGLETDGGESSAVSTICASAIGEPSRRSRGSPGKQTVPSGMARISPEKRNLSR